MSSSTYQLTERELEAAEIVRKALEARGGLPASGLNISPTTAAALKSLNLISSPSELESSPSTPTPGQRPLPTLAGDPLPPHLKISQYVPLQARPFTASEIECGAHKLTRETKASRIVQHPVGAVVEYPEAGTSAEEIVFHHFAVDPEGQVHPKDNIQYSMGATHGSSGTHRKRYCNWLTPNGHAGSRETRCECSELVVSCEGVKSCLFGRKIADLEPHSYVPADHRWDTPELPAPSDHATKEIFQKTLGFFCAISRLGCNYPAEKEKTASRTQTTEDQMQDSCDNEDIEEDLTLSTDANNASEPLGTATLPADLKCKGKILLEYTAEGVPFVRCEYRSIGHAAHLRSFNIQEYDLRYLKALLILDFTSTSKIEEEAAKEGYGPLVECNYTVAKHARQKFCPHWHRNSKGDLVRVPLEISPCTARWRIYTPVKLAECPFIGILAVGGPHIHPPPCPAKTPEAYRRIFNWLLESMDWRLANATPRRVLRDEGVIASLRHLLSGAGINPRKEPSLLLLHPSFTNFDHMAWMIDQVKNKYYPNGVDFEAAVHLCKEHLQLPNEERYVRRAEIVPCKGEANGLLVVLCMFPSQSRELVAARTLQSDTAHKRAKMYLEFEIGAWDSTVNRAITLARVFFKSQSAEAHFEVLKMIFEVILEDTGEEWKFRHIHSPSLLPEDWVGAYLLTVDDHRGQGLGWGLFFVWLASRLAGSTTEIFDLHEVDKPLKNLTPYDHVSRIVRWCLVHHLRRLLRIEGSVTPQIFDRMFRVAGTEVIANYEENLTKIREEGSISAKNWLAEKEIADRWGIKGLYQPLSNIPLLAWKAGQSNTNAKEAKQGDILLEGKHGTLIGAIMTGMRYDAKAAISLSTLRKQGINHTYTISTHTHRAGVSLQRNVRAGKRKTAAVDEEIANVQTRISTKAALAEDQYRMAVAAGGLQRESPEKKKLRSTQADLAILREQEARLLKTGSGKHHSLPEPDNNIPSVFLEPKVGHGYDEKTLMGLPKVTLVLLCQQRRLPYSGRKDQLAQRILEEQKSSKESSLSTTAATTASASSATDSDGTLRPPSATTSAPDPSAFASTLPDSESAVLSSPTPRSRVSTANPQSLAPTPATLDPVSGNSNGPTAQTPLAMYQTLPYASGSWSYSQMVAARQHYWYYALNSGYRSFGPSASTLNQAYSPTGSNASGTSHARQGEWPPPPA